MKEKNEIDWSTLNLARLAHNFLMRSEKDGSTIEQINRVNSYLINVMNPEFRDLKKFKVGIVLVCINPPYWQYLKPLLGDIKNYFLPGHDVDVLLWSDIGKLPEFKKQLSDKLEAATTLEQVVEAFLNIMNLASYLQVEELIKLNAELLQQKISVKSDGKKWWLEANTPLQDGALLKEKARTLLAADWMKGINGKIFEAESVSWPLPTLMRYQLFLNEEETLKQYDYLFYIDVDMRIVNYVGDEILGNGLTAAPHPGYYLRDTLVPPFEPNPNSEAFIKMPGRVVEVNGKKSFKPFYAAGGFQGGRSADFIKAMKKMKEGTDKDFLANYIARWNDESHWNRYLFDNPPAVYLTPSYVYPDSLIQELYVKIWGQNFTPRIVTVTKPFTTSTEDGKATNELLKTI